MVALNQAFEIGVSASGIDVIETVGGLRTRTKTRAPTAQR